MKAYKSFVGAPRKNPEYDCEDLVADGYVLKVSCDKKNPDCAAYVADKTKEGCLVRVVELKSANGRRIVCDIWIKDKSIISPYIL